MNDLCQTEPEIYFSTKSSEHLHVIIILQVTCRRRVPQHKTFEVKNITKREQHAIETLIKNYLVK